MHLWQPWDVAQQCANRPFQHWHSISGHQKETQENQLI